MTKQYILVPFAIIFSFYIKAQTFTSEVALKWGDMTLKTFYKLPRNSPTYCSRSLGYIGLTMYESVVAGSKQHHTLAGQLSGLKTLPKPIPKKRYNWNLALSAGQAFILKKLISSSHIERVYSIDSLDYEVQQLEKPKESEEVFERSIAYGQSIASAIYEWSKIDGGDSAYACNFDLSYVFPKGSGYWIPPKKGQVVSPVPLHPYWGRNRFFVPNNSLLPTPPIMPYSAEPNSAYYKLFDAVYQKNKQLTETEKEIAAWWADDPTETYSPPGHSYSLAGILARKTNADLFSTAEMYARVGIAVADAFINCWKCKFVYHSERPSTYVKANIDPTWEQFWPEPPFPAYLSGHATQGAAMATVLADIVGNDFTFIDNTHEGRTPDPRDPKGILFKPRTYKSLWEAAEESAYSRFLGGIHTEQDNNVGLEEGRKIGQNVNALKWKY